MAQDPIVNETVWNSLGALIRAQRSAAGLSLRDLAERTSISNAYLSQIERGLHEPSLTVLRAVADALKLPLSALLERAGVLESASRDSPAASTESAIMLDPELSEPQRIALLSVYRSFVPPHRRG
ncbi:MAG: helix-turn-helix transcriptional regulator [Solirubrobacterales bacterium]|jgi:transcriptional regulator with XRE-family HTH domain|nr:helix-turn-helix transcriptional regulator [Solirubrobacterales bacterium]